MFHLTLILTLTQANDQLHLLAVLEHERGEGVPKVVESDIRQAGALEERLVGAAVEVVAAHDGADGKTPSNRTQFAIFSKSPFDTSLYSKAKDAEKALERWNKQVSDMHPSDVEVVKKLQPYYGGHGADTHPLFALNQLSNWDKHREY